MLLEEAGCSHGESIDLGSLLISILGQSHLLCCSPSTCEMERTEAWGWKEASREEVEQGWALGGRGRAGIWFLEIRNLATLYHGDKVM